MAKLIETNPDKSNQYVIEKKENILKMVSNKSKIQTKIIKKQSCTICTKQKKLKRNKKNNYS